MVGAEEVVLLSDFENYSPSSAKEERVASFHRLSSFDRKAQKFSAKEAFVAEGDGRRESERDTNPEPECSFLHFFV